MDTFEAILQSLPKTAFKLNSGGTAYVDLTNRGVTITGTLSLTTTGLVSGSTKCHTIAAGTALNFPTTVFVRSQEQRGFTLEATVLPMDTLTDFVSLLSHNAVEDGLYIKGNEIRFTIEFNTLGTVTVAFPIPTDYEAYTVQAVYDVSKIQLYINGYLYSEADITAAQRKDGFKTRASNNLYIGQGAVSGKRVGIDAIAVYGRSLTDSEVYLHFNAVNYVVPHKQLAGVYGGSVSLDGGANSRNIIFYKRWEPQWDENATFDGTAVQADRLVPELVYGTQVSKAGTWLASINVDGWPAIYNMVIRWTGAGGFTVEVSLNGGTSWTAVTSGVPITGTWAIATTNIKPLVRVTFTGGVLNDTAHLKELTATTYGDSLVYSSDATRALPASAVAYTWDREHEPIQRGVRKGFSTTGSSILPADTGSTDPSTFQTIETWVMWDDPTASQYAYDLRPSIANGYLWIAGANFGWAIGTMYINGVLSTANTVPLYPDRWFHFVHVLPAAYNTPIEVGTRVAGRATYSVFNLHPSALTASQALSLFNAYHGYPTARLATDANPVTEGAGAYKTYQTDWALTPTGM